MSLRRSRIRTTASQVAAEVRAKNVAFMAGSIAYNAFVSLLPLLLLLVLTVSVVGSGALERRVIELAATYLAPGVGDTLREVLREADDSTGFSLVGIVVLLWGTLKIFRGLDTAFAEIYETDDEDSVFDRFRDGFVVFAALSVAVVAMVTTGSAFAALAQRLAIGILNPLFLVVALSVAFFPLYYVFPNVDVSIGNVLPGLVTAAAGWAVLQALFQVYVAASGKTDAYGLLGGIVLLVTWLYFAGLLLLLGAVINAVVGGYVGGTAVGDARVDGGGRGTASTAEKTMREDRLNRDQAARYLRRLREDVARRYEEMEPTETGGTPGRPRMSETGTLNVTERVFDEGENGVDDEGDRQTYEVTLQWRVAEADAGVAETTTTADTTISEPSSTPTDD
ncbi:hypothetical protein AUR64_04855 [Haloprofundus marisrubri]|uniref:Uncharacterized protein n=1 Tax=Haloprofundus marisrubri TaxID=1514971 RepID=A0A0W1RDX4_9EURY|nr:YihY/virulence factor BrkB family protein [Haloprofundus marisrubri]KTG11258.1 hypothetical protein AUR64_04855 [Haloprofundus marisrubri]